MTRALLLSCLLLAAGLPRASADPPPASSPEDLVRRAIEAIGGREAMEKTNESETMEGDLELFIPLQNKAHFIAWHKGKKLLMEVQAGGLKAKVCFNGANGWKELLGSVSDLSTEEKGEHEVSSEHDTDL